MQIFATILTYQYLKSLKILYRLDVFKIYQEKNISSIFIDY